MSWVRGKNIPALASRGRSKILDLVGLQLVGNLITNVQKIPTTLLVDLYEALEQTPWQRQKMDPLTVLSSLAGVNVKTLRGWERNLDDRVNGAMRSRNANPSRQPLAATTAAISESLPECLLGDVATDSDDEDFGLDALPGGEPTSTLQRWQSHPAFAKGIRLAEIATMWHVHGWSKNQYGNFMAWLRKHFPDQVGNLQHSKIFLDGFLPSLVATAHTCLAASLHSIVPALGIPSLLSRVVDVVSINGRSLFPIIHIYTSTTGRLSWALLGCPCLEYIPDAASGQPLATGEQCFGFHKAKQLVKIVHSTEKSYHIQRLDRKMRLVVTVADQAIQGPGSVQFSREEARIDGVVEQPLGAGTCKFHIADGVGAGVDKRFRETTLFDQLLRLIRRHFAWGTGNLILQSVAQKFATMATDIEQEARDMFPRIAAFEAAGQPLAANRARANHARKSAEAEAFHRMGWTKHRRPAAPKADGTRKVVYQSYSRENFFKIYGLVYWGLRIRMYQTVEEARLAVTKQGKTPTQRTGLNTKQMKAWRSLGVSITDIRMLVFNMGRSDFRRKHLVSYALEVQSSMTLSSLEAGLATNESMLAAIGALVSLRGIVKMVQSICRGFLLEETAMPHASGKPRCIISNALFLKNRREALPSKSTLWVLCRTLFAHMGFRCFPTLSMRLTDTKVNVLAALVEHRYMSHAQSIVFVARVPCP